MEQTAAPDSPPYPFRFNEQSHAIVEIRSVEVQIEGSEHTARFLVDVFGFRANGRRLRIPPQGSHVDVHRGNRLALRAKQ
jgi:hypothetical protein